MTAEIENLILEHLRRMRGSLDAVREDVGDLKLRMPALEGHLGQMQVHLGQVQVQLAGQSSRMDRFDERLGRIERRPS